MPVREREGYPTIWQETGAHVLDLPPPSIPMGGAGQELYALEKSLNETQYWPAERLREHQSRQLQLIVEHAYRARPFYAARLAASGYRPGQIVGSEFWQGVPILRRREVQDNFAAITDGFVPAEHLPETWDSTSGSSGMPLRIRTTRRAQMTWLASALRDDLWHKRDFASKSAVIRRSSAGDAFPPHGKSLLQWGAPAALLYRTGPAVLLDFRSTTQAQAEWLLRERPAYLLTFPSIIRELAAHFRRSGLELPGLKSLRSYGEAYSSELNELCREAFGVELVDTYSAAETGYLALQCPEFKRYHVQSESVLVEILDEDGRPCAPGSIGNVVVTPFHNFAMPLLRYSIGDLAEMGPPCPCGRALPVLARILGKARDCLVLPGGQRRFAYFGSKTIANMAQIVQFQLAQKSLYDLEARLVTRGSFGPADEEKLRQMLNENLGSHLRITFTYPDAIARSASGKYLDFVNELPDGAYS